MRHMYILISTNNMPNIMLESIAVSPALGLFYVTFLVLALYLVMNILLANIYSAYKDLLEVSVIDFYASRRRSVDMAYDLLLEEEGGEGGIGETTLHAFLGELLGPCTHTVAVLQLLDEDNSGKIDCDEFRLVAEVLADPTFHAVSDEAGCCKWMARFDSHIESLDNLCDYLSALAFALVLYQTCEGIETGNIGDAVDVMC